MSADEEVLTNRLRRLWRRVTTQPSPRFAALVGSTAALLVAVVILIPWLVSPSSDKVLGLTDPNPGSEWQRYVSTFAKTLDEECANHPGTQFVVSDSDAAFPDLLAKHEVPVCRIVRPTGATPMSAEAVASGIFIDERENNQPFSIPHALTLTEADSGESGISFSKSQALHCTLLRAYVSTAAHFGFGEYRCTVK
ncbi:MAG TPA: hypothetical protein VIK54_09835 [Acidimicrobiia bacterium]